MSDINTVTIIGRLTRDAELKYTSSGFAVSKFSIAVNRRKKSGDQWVEEANFFDITLWGRRAEALNQYLTKGTQVASQGELRQSRWEQDGQSRSKVEVNANDIQLLGGGSRGGGASGSQNGQQGGRKPAQDYSILGPGDIEAEDDFEDDVPF